MSPLAQCWLTAAAIFVAAKLALVALERRRGPVIVAWAFLWPGMDPARDLRCRARRTDEGEIASGLTWLAIGLVAMRLAASIGSVAGGALAAVAMALVLHFGAFRLLAAAWHRAGRDVRPLMQAPGFARSLAEAWGRRWNAAYSALTRRFVTGPLAPRLGRSLATFASFVVSGLVHELVLTIPAGGGYGGPTAYFVLQGAGVALERSSIGRALGLGRGDARSRAFALGVLLVPLPLLLTRPVLVRVALPLATLVFGDGPMNDSLLSLALWLAVLAHCCVIVGGIQVPRQLRWREELASLSRFNRNLMWVYHAFIGFVLVAFAALTAALHDEMLHGDRAAVGLAMLIAAFWTLRLVVDVLVYRHADWPKGRAFAVGHVLLVVAFLGMAGTYWSVVAHAIT